METTTTFKKNDFSSENNREKDFYTYTTGYVLLFISSVSFGLLEYFDLKGKQDFLSGMFFFHYLMAVAFLLVLISTGSFGFRKIWFRENIHKGVILFNLYLISAYSLNKEIVVFENSAAWLCVYVILSSLTLLSFRFFDRLSRLVNSLQYLLLGSAVCLYVYLALYVFQVYLLGAIGTLFFGIGLHIFIPLALLVCCALLLKYTLHTSRASFLWIASGVVIPVLCVGLFIGEWNSRISKIEKISNQSVLYRDEQLPSWIKIAQTIENDWITQRILKSNLTYSIASENFWDWEFAPQRVSWDEARRHDPFVYLASIFTKLSLPDEETIKVLQALSDARHTAQERLWAGDNLSTSYIVSDIDIYPNLHLAYTEKYLTVRNKDKKNRWWGSREEAIYTFQLQEGSVVTSLSLWINGKEEKAILTSKQKAATAYKTIVGVEKRDPSIIQWQEGNAVSVRVFPCTEKEERKFKIGITSPLTEVNGKLQYQNITFRGPNAHLAKETIRVSFIGDPQDVTIPDSFKKDRRGNYISEANYNPDLAISLKSAEIKDNRFSFDGYTYSMSKLKLEYSPSTISNIYLDVNSSWTDTEFEELKPLLGTHKMFVFCENEFISLNKGNWEELKEEMLGVNFSLFAFYKIKNPDSAVVVTKGKVFSPHLSDVKESKFAQKTGEYFADGKRIKTFNLSGWTSTYIGSFRELRGLEFAEGSTTDFKVLLEKKQFPITIESDEKVALHDAGLIISKIKGTDSTIADNAPDHLARLFAYNDIMRKVGSGYHKDDFINEELVDEAISFYVVSPVSSLIVLETKQDYERFDIKGKENSLHNATKNSSGAVPEPHEWALIILFGMLILYSLRQTRNRLSL